MSLRIKVICKNGLRYWTDRERADLRVAAGVFRWRELRIIEEIEPRFRLALDDGPLGTGNAIPFAPISNRLKAPPKVHYAIPAAGAHTRLMRVYWNNFIPSVDATASGRNGAVETAGTERVFSPTGAPSRSSM